MSHLQVATSLKFCKQYCYCLLKFCKQYCYIAKFFFSIEKPLPHTTHFSISVANLWTLIITDLGTISLTSKTVRLRACILHVSKRVSCIFESHRNLQGTLSLAHKYVHNGLVKWAPVCRRTYGLYWYDEWSQHNLPRVSSRIFQGWGARSSIRATVQPPTLHEVGVGGGIMRVLT